MWKLVIGFIILAAVAIFVLMKGGDIDMSGEKHGAAQPEGQAQASLVMIG